MTTREKFQYLFSRYRRQSRGSYLVNHGVNHVVNTTRKIRELTGKWDLPVPEYRGVSYQKKAYKPTRAMRLALKRI